MVPRTGPFSASCAFCRTSWYQRGKSSPRGVRTGLFGHVRRVLRGPCGALVVNPTDLIENISDLVAGISIENPIDSSSMAIDVQELRAQPLDPEIEAELVRFEDGVQPLPRRRDRRRRLPGLPPEPGHLRPAPGRPQPDGAGEDPVRPGRARPARDARPTSPRRTRAAGATSPPARTCSSTSCSSSRRPRCCACSRRSGSRSREACGDTVRNVDGLPPRRRVPLRGARHHARGPRPPPTSSCATRSRSGCRASSRSTSRAAPPTAARRCSTTSA